VKNSRNSSRITWKTIQTEEFQLPVKFLRDSHNLGSCVGAALGIAALAVKPSPRPTGFWCDYVTAIAANRSKWRYSPMTMVRVKAA
jgi:hypothetical protein